MEAGDLLAVRSAGAYGFVMSSNYNTRPRAAEVMVDGTAHHLVRARESQERLLHLKAACRNKHRKQTMALSFTKMHGLGNDFAVVDGVTQAITLSAGQIKAFADRHLGIGYDQLLLVEPLASQMWISTTGFLMSMAVR